MTYKTIIGQFIASTLITASLPFFAFAAPPQLPHLFYGTVTVNGENAPVGTTIIATVNGEEKGRITTESAGQYGGISVANKKLAVQGDILSDAAVNFRIGNNTAAESAQFGSGRIEAKNLSFSFSSLTVPSSNLSSLLSDGVLVVNGTSENAVSLTAPHETIITIPTGASISSITLPKGTVITSVSGDPFNAAALTSSLPSLSSLSGLGQGVVADGVLQWGIANLGLQFTNPISISLFVGTALNGQTLNVVRSISSTGGWTNDGIVPPAVCVVSEGVCAFSATKASFYAATHTVPAVSSVQSTSPSNSNGSVVGGGTSVLLPPSIVFPSQPQISEPGGGGIILPLPGEIAVPFFTPLSQESPFVVASTEPIPTSSASESIPQSGNIEGSVIEGASGEESVSALTPPQEGEEVAQLPFSTSPEPSEEQEAGGFMAAVGNAVRNIVGTTGAALIGILIALGAAGYLVYGYSRRH